MLLLWRRALLRGLMLLLRHGTRLLLGQGTLLLRGRPLLRSRVLLLRLQVLLGRRRVLLRYWLLLRRLTWLLLRQGTLLLRCGSLLRSCVLLGWITPSRYGSPGRPRCRGMSGRIIITGSCPGGGRICPGHGSQRMQVADLGRSC
jgi:hypothetical protein